MLDNKVYKLLELNTSKNISIIRVEKILLLTQEQPSSFELNYILVPKEVDIFIQNSLLTFVFFKSNTFVFKNFYVLLQNFLKNKIALVRTTLTLKGVGFRMTHIKELTTIHIGLGFKCPFIEFKLGFSHLLRLEIPEKSIKILLRKNKIRIEGRCKKVVGDFVTKIKSLKLPDVYKGKGFLLKYEKKLLKAIKKK